MHRISSQRFFQNRISLATAIAIAVVASADTAAADGVTTYHNDNFRTGWNSAETILTPTSVQSSAFGLIAQTTLDEQVDAQPLVLPAVQIAGAPHAVAYVATENNTVYAIDAVTGAVLLSRNYGTPVPYTSLPAQCINNSATVGINSTGVIDPAAGILYFIAYTVENSTLTYRLHAVGVSTLADVEPSVIVAASAKLKNGTVFPFNASFQRQRPALLLSHGNIYAGFGSFCDGAPQISRGWLLGWNASTLTALPANRLNNSRSTSAYNWFLTSIWMSGYGLAADTAGNIYFATGNSDYSGKSYSPTNNLSESVIKVAPDLSSVVGFFTPSNHSKLDQSDSEMGSGGVMLLPPQAAPSPNMAVASGKANGTYLLNTDAFSTTSQIGNKLGQYITPRCWCGPSTYVGFDGQTRVVTSPGDAITVWGLGAGATPALTAQNTTAPLGSGPDDGMFTAISSNAQVPNTAVIWTVLRAAAADTTNTLTIKAFDPANKLATLFSAPAGTWPYDYQANSNVVPTISGGYVYVASYKQLSIFGLSPANPPAHAALIRPAPSGSNTVPSSNHQFFGIVHAATVGSLIMTLRDGRLLTIDEGALANQLDPNATRQGSAIVARGNANTPSGALQATSILRVKNTPRKWPADQ